MQLHSVIYYQCWQVEAESNELAGMYFLYEHSSNISELMTTSNFVLYKGHSKVG